MKHLYVMQPLPISSFFLSKFVEYFFYLTVCHLVSVWWPLWKYFSVWPDWATNFLTKEAQIFAIVGLFGKISLLSAICCGFFLATFEICWQLLMLTSDHSCLYHFSLGATFSEHAFHLFRSLYRYPIHYRHSNAMHWVHQSGRCLFKSSFPYLFLVTFFSIWRFFLSMGFLSFLNLQLFVHFLIWSSRLKYF